MKYLITIFLMLIATSADAASRKGFANKQGSDYYVTVMTATNRNLHYKLLTSPEKLAAYDILAKRYAEVIIEGDVIENNFNRLFIIPRIIREEPIK